MVLTLGRGQPDANRDSGTRRDRARAGPYGPLYEYLMKRYADTVVLTFAEVTDLLGFALPEVAHRQEEWWVRPETDRSCPRHDDSWILVHRTATPNLLAKTVTFERVPEPPLVTARK